MSQKLITNESLVGDLKKLICEIYTTSKEVQSKMERFSCCVGLLGSEAYHVNEATNKIILDSLTALDEKKWHKYITGFSSLDELDDINIWGDFEYESYKKKNVVILVDSVMNQYKIVDYNSEYHGQLRDDYKDFHTWKEYRTVHTDLESMLMSEINLRDSIYNTVMKELRKYHKILNGMIEYIYS